MIVYCRTTRIERPSCLSLARPAKWTPSGSSRSAQAIVKAFLCITMFCGETTPVLLKGVTVEAPGEVTLTFWNWPAVMTAVDRFLAETCWEIDRQVESLVILVRK